MNIALYNNTSARNVVNKKIQNKTTFENVVFFNEEFLSVTEPIIDLKIDNSIVNSTKYNYCYIPTLGRYYYITDIKAINGLVRIYCKSDPLMSFASDIKKSKQYVLRSNKNENPYINDLLMPIQINNYYRALPFGDNVDDRSCGRVILMTAGRGGHVV